MPTGDEIYTLGEHLERYRGVTLQILHLVPEDMLGWQPAPQLRSFAEHFLHLARTEDYYTRGFFNEDWDIERLKIKA
ncbi:MAG TPA: DinB family protein [Pyrinomonadaceae bacterium]|nr:DinB family protein [Pyrinomonadaceae bacterium]